MVVLIIQLPFHPRHQWMHFFENEQSRRCSTSWKLFITLVLVHFCTFYPRADDSREWRWVIYLWVIHRQGQVLNCNFFPTLPSLVLNSSPLRSPYNTGWWLKRLVDQILIGCIESAVVILWRGLTKQSTRLARSDTAKEWRWLKITSIW